MGARALTRQELVAESRDVEQVDLGDSWNVCPDNGLCEWCLRDELDDRLCGSEEDDEDSFHDYGSYDRGLFTFGEMFRMRT